jgi:hypothetical protein
MSCDVPDSAGGPGHPHSLLGQQDHLAGSAGEFEASGWCVVRRHPLSKVRQSRLSCRAPMGHEGGEARGARRAVLGSRRGRARRERTAEQGQGVARHRLPGPRRTALPASRGQRAPAAYGATPLYARTDRPARGLRRVLPGRRLAADGHGVGVCTPAECQRLRPAGRRDRGVPARREAQRRPRRARGGQDHAAAPRGADLGAAAGPQGGAGPAWAPTTDWRCP